MLALEAIVEHFGLGGCAQSQEVALPRVCPGTAIMLSGGNGLGTCRGILRGGDEGRTLAAEKDVDLVVQARFFPGETRGVLVEVGAAKPDFLSVGASFRKLGWTVISVEPNPVFCEAHRAAGHDVLQFACSDQDQDDVDFYVVDSGDAAYGDGTVSAESFSSLGVRGEFAEDLAKTKSKTSVKTIKVKVRRLDTLLAEFYPDVTAIDVLAIDVEGWELEVMRGLSFARYRPEVVIVENLFRSRSYRRFMRGLGYHRWARLKPNEVYVRGDVRRSVWERVRGSFR